jgi:hypothetical protein
MMTRLRDKLFVEDDAIGAALFVEDDARRSLRLLFAGGLSTA